MVTKPRRVGFYLRVSTTGQTVENQRQALQAVADQRGWRVVGEYVDHGISGAKGRAHRPAFDQLSKDAAHGKLDLVAAWSIDRIGRSLGHLVEFMDELRQQSVGIYLHQQQVDTATAAGRAFLQMAGVFAEFEREIIRERIHAGLARARKKGTKLGRKKSITAKVERQILELSRTANPANPKGGTYGKHAIAKKVGCGVSTVQRVLRQTA